MRCKVGDLVLISNDREFPENNGSFGEIHSAIAPGEVFVDDGANWWVLPQHNILCWRGPLFLFTGLSAGDVVAYCDDELTPFRPGLYGIVEEAVKELTT